MFPLVAGSRRTTKAISLNLGFLDVTAHLAEMASSIVCQSSSPHKSAQVPSRIAFTTKC